jgi:hypothetical protein
MKTAKFKVLRNGDWIDYAREKDRVHEMFQVLLIGTEADCLRKVNELKGHVTGYPHHAAGDHPQPGENQISNPKHPTPLNYVKERLTP